MLGYKLGEITRFVDDRDQPSTAFDASPFERLPINDKTPTLTIHLKGIFVS